MRYLQISCVIEGLTPIGLRRPRGHGKAGGGYQSSDEGAMTRHLSDRLRLQRQDAPPQRVTDQVGLGAQVQLVHQMRPVRLHGTWAYE